MAHAYASYISKALVLATNLDNPLVAGYFTHPTAEARLTAYAEALATFSKHVLENPGRPLDEAVEASGIETHGRDVRTLVGYCIGCVVLGAWHGAVAECDASSHLPHLDNLQPNLHPPRKGFRAWFRRHLIRLANWL
jgi:hypothetical protein